MNPGRGFCFCPLVRVDPGGGLEVFASEFFLEFSVSRLGPGLVGGLYSGLRGVEPIVVPRNSRGLQPFCFLKIGVARLLRELLLQL